MLRENKLDVRLASSSYLGAVRIDDHVVKNYIVASCDKLIVAIDFDDTDATGTYLVYILQITQRGDVEPRFLGGIKDCSVFRYRNLKAVDSDLYHCIVPSLRKAP